MLNQSHTAITWPTSLGIISNDVLVIWIFRYWLNHISKLGGHLKVAKHRWRGADVPGFADKNLWIRSRDSSALNRKRMWILSTYRAYSLIGCRTSVDVSRYWRKLLGIFGGPAISLALCKPMMSRSNTKPTYQVKVSLIVDWNSETGEDKTTHRRTGTQSSKTAIPW